MREFFRGWRRKAGLMTLAVACLRLLQREAPNLFGDYTLHTFADGSEVADTPFRKV